MNDLLINYLRYFKLCSDQITPNVFQVVNAIDTLNKQLGLKLTIHDINYIYNLQNTCKFEVPRSGWYLKARRGPPRIISCLIPIKSRMGATSLCQGTGKLTTFIAPLTSGIQVCGISIFAYCVSLVIN